MYIDANNDTGLAGVNRIRGAKAHFANFSNQGFPHGKEETIDAILRSDRKLVVWVTLIGTGRSLIGMGAWP